MYLQSEDQIDKGAEVIIALNDIQGGGGDDPFMDQYRARRLQELKEQAKAPGIKRCYFLHVFTYIHSKKKF